MRKIICTVVSVLALLSWVVTASAQEEKKAKKVKEQEAVISNVGQRTI
ncbi:MAG: hypothetical protein GTO09_11185, partial [Candidatus Latescibacteria bacterium]|nr:hypothetical protein [Candidatus Latescibacterota bacterium]